jgi:hypothetical protein
LYLAHHLGYNGAPEAIPLLYDEKYKDTPMKDVLYKAGLKTAATRKGNPWSYDKNPKLTFGQYRKMKEKAYEDLRERYRGQSLEELSAESAKQFGPPVDFDRRTIDGGTTTFNPVKIIGDSYTKGGMGFSAGGHVKCYKRGGETYSDEPLYRAPLEDWDEVFKRQYGDDSLVLPLEDWEKFMPAPPDVVADEIDLYKSITKGNKADVRPNKVNVINDFTATVPQKAPRGPNVLRMPENPADWKTREPGVFEKARERSKDPKGIGYWDDFLSQIPGLEITPSTSGKVPTDQKIVLPIDDKGWNYKPNPNLYMDPLGEWGNSGDPVDNFYNEMSDMIGKPGPGYDPEAPAPDMPPGGPGGRGGAGDTSDDDIGDPEVAMLKQLYRERLKDYLEYQKPKKESVFGMFGDVNEPLLKLGLSILASKGSFGEALGEAGLASLEDRDKRQMKDQQEKAEKLKEALDMRYKNAMIESMDPSSKLKLQQAKSEYDAQIAQMKLDGAIERALLSADRSQENAILTALMKKRDIDPDYVYKQNELEWLQSRKVPVGNPEDAGFSLF